MRLLLLIPALVFLTGLKAQQFVSFQFERTDGLVAPVMKQAQAALLAMDGRAVLSGEDRLLKVRVSDLHSPAEVLTVLQQSTGGVFRLLHSSGQVRAAQENSIQPVLPEGVGKVSSDDIMALLAAMAEAHGGPAYVDTGNEEEDGARFVTAFEEWSVTDPEGSAALLNMVRSMLQTH